MMKRRKVGTSNLKITKPKFLNLVVYIKSCVNQICAMKFYEILLSTVYVLIPKTCHKYILSYQIMFSGYLKPMRKRNIQSSSTFSQSGCPPTCT